MEGAHAAVREESRARFSALLAQLWKQQPEPESPERDGPGLTPGARLGRFEILGELGRGGFGVVYEAFDPELGRKVAIKMLRPSRRALDDAQRQRLRDEARARRRVRLRRDDARGAGGAPAVRGAGRPERGARRRGARSALGRGPGQSGRVHRALLGELDRALDRAAGILAVGSRTGTPALTIWGHLLAARAAERQGRVDVVSARLAAAREAGAAANIALAEYVASLVEALLALQRGERARAVDAVHRALSLGRERHVALHHVWFARGETAEICALAAEHGIEPDHARRLAAPETA
jgi:hypothetical protein